MDYKLYLVSNLLTSIKDLLVVMEENDSDHYQALHELINTCIDAAKDD